MKKIFALVLALVMAMSLTTAAWGASVASESELKAALAAATAGDTVTLTDSFTVTFASQEGFVIPDGVTLDGNGKTVTLEGVPGNYQAYAAFCNVNNGADVVVKNMNVVNNLTAGYPLVFTDATLNNVDVTGGANAVATSIYGLATDALVLNNCDFVGQTLMAVYMDESSAATPVHIENCTFDCAGTAIILRNDESTVVGSTFDAKINFYAEGSAANAAGNTFNARVKLYNDDEVLSGNSFGATGVIALETGVDEESIDLSGNYWGGSTPSDTQLPYDDVVVNTYCTTVAANGSVSGLTSNVPSTSNAAKYTLWGAKVAATATGVNYIATDMQLPDVTKAVAPVAPALNGSVAYYTVFGTKYIQGTADDCDVYFTIKGKTVPVLYLKEIGSVNYFAAATEFTNFGKACGQVKVTPVAGTKYYTYTDANDVVYVHAEDTSVGAFANSNYFLLVNNKMVPIVTTNLNTNLVPHSWAFSKNAKGVVDSAKCVDCGVTAAVYSTYTAVPTGADYIREGAYFLVINAPVVTDKVESAETFDAGIAMYVGMSVMAAAGSVVVLKKRED